MAADRQAEHALLDLLERFTRQAQKVSPYKGHNYAPAMFAGHANANGYGKTALADAMQRLLDAGTIRIEETGPPSKRRSLLVRT